jgi:hypothetical protein
MPNWKEVLEEVKLLSCEEGKFPFEEIRDKYLKLLHETTNRNVIAYYSGWLHRNGVESGITDIDQNAFMTMVHGLDRSKGLDLILHTPGGNIAATQSIGHYIKSMFNDDIRVIVPHLAMSAGTMIACASKEIIMGKHSSLGPTDPQFGQLSASAILEEFDNAKKEVEANPKVTELWKVIISKYSPTLLGECDKACEWGKTIIKNWLKDNMFKADKDAQKKADIASEFLGNHKISKHHSKHFSVEELRNMKDGVGLKIGLLEKDQTFQDLVLTVHHTFMHTFANSSAIKIIQNHTGIKVITTDNNKK